MIHKSGNSSLICVAADKERGAGPGSYVYPWTEQVARGVGGGGKGVLTISQTRGHSWHERIEIHPRALVRGAW